MAMMTSPDPMRVLVVDDHDTFAELLVGALDREVDMVCVGHATTGAEGVAMVGRLGADEQLGEGVMVVDHKHSHRIW